MPTGALVATGHAGDGRQPPTYAYYYIWFSATSWKRAKKRLPVAGAVLQRRAGHDAAAHQVGEAGRPDGLDRLLEGHAGLTDGSSMLATIAAQERFKLSVIYQGLDFQRRPFQSSRVAQDLEILRRPLRTQPGLRVPRPVVIIWSGTWKFTADQIESVTANRRCTCHRGEERNGEYQRKATSVDGDAYYWSSVNPDIDPYAGEAAGDQHRRPPDRRVVVRACPGRLRRSPHRRDEVVPRKGGETLREELQVARRSLPDMVGVICWNEYSENSPGRAERAARVHVARGTRRRAARHRDHVPPLTSTPVRRPAGTVH